MLGLETKTLLTPARVLVLALSFALTIATPALAQESECENDGDCGVGFICQELGVPSIACACPEEEEDCGCDDIEQPEPVNVCAPAPCDSDDQCGEGWACQTWTEDCADAPQKAEPGGAPCQPGEDCESGGSDDEPSDGGGSSEDGGDEMGEDDDEANDCEPETYGECVPKWATECTADADCGAGFTCKPAEICECWGSAGSGSSEPNTTETDEPPDEGDSASGGGSDGSSGSSGSSEGDEPAPDDPGTEDDEDGDNDDDDEGDHGDGEFEDGDDEDWEENCECYETDEMWCHPDEIECEADADCPTDWTCESHNNTAVSTCGFDPDSGEEDCVEEEAPEDSTSMCYPPFFDDFDGGGMGGGGYDLATSADAEEGGNGGPAGADPQDSGSNGGGGGDGDAAPSSGGDDGDEASDDAGGGGGGGSATTDDGDSGSGCNGAAPLSGLVPVLMSLLALVGLRRRREV